LRRAPHIRHALAGQKANVEPAKATLGPLCNGAIRLDPAALETVVGEGIETSASAGLLLGLPAWAAVCAGNLAKLILPESVRIVTIAADRDATHQSVIKATKGLYKSARLDMMNHEERWTQP
jgi:putative DNA primase/helicase